MGSSRAARRLVFVLIPGAGIDPGVWKWTADALRAIGHEALAPLVRRFGPMGSWGPEALREVFLHDVPADIAQAAERFNGTPGPGMFREPWPLDAWPEVPTSVLAPRGDRLFPLAFQRRVARERLGLAVDELPGGHLPMLARPRELAARLATINAGAA